MYLLDAKRLPLHGYVSIAKEVGDLSRKNLICNIGPTAFSI
jgi:hypothetical protein